MLQCHEKACGKQLYLFIYHLPEEREYQIIYLIVVILTSILTAPILLCRMLYLFLCCNNRLKPVGFDAYGLGEMVESSFYFCCRDKPVQILPVRTFHFHQNFSRRLTLRFECLPVDFFFHSIWGQVISHL